MLRQESSSECSPLQETKRSFFAHPGTPLTPISNRTSRKLPNSTGSRKQKGLKIATEVLRNRLENAGEVDFSRIVNDALEDLSAGVDHSFNEKNVRRRMYDTLNVLRAIGVIEKENGKLRWSGVLDKKSGESIEFDLRSPNDLEVRKNHLESRIARKKRDLEELEADYATLDWLISRNARRSEGEGECAEEKKLELPFIIVSSNSSQRIQCEVSSDLSSALLDFCGKFRMADDAACLHQLMDMRDHEDQIEGR